MEKKGRRKFDQQFQREAVRLIEAGTMPIAEVARQLGVHVETLRNWRRKAGATSDGDPARTVPSLEEENRRLRRENARLLEEREILRKRRPSSPRMHDEIRVHPRARAHLPHHDDVSGARGVEGRVLQVACAAAQ